MALTPEEIKAKRIASKRKQIATKLAQIAKTEEKRSAKQEQQLSYANLLLTETDAKKIASLSKKNNKAIEQIIKYNSAIDRYELKRLEYAQELAVLQGPL